MFPDDVSIMIERAFWRWMTNGKKKDIEYCRLFVDPDHILDFTVMLQIHIFDNRRQRPVKRGSRA